MFYVGVEEANGRSLLLSSVQHLGHRQGKTHGFGGEVQRKRCSAAGGCVGSAEVPSQQ